jgi:hypothetical protein
MQMDANGGNNDPVCGLLDLGSFSWCTRDDDLQLSECEKEACRYSYDVFLRVSGVIITALLSMGKTQYFA